DDDDEDSDSDSSDSDQPEAQVGLKPGMKRPGLEMKPLTKHTKTESAGDGDEEGESDTAFFGKLSYDLDEEGLQAFLKKKGIKFNSVRIISQSDGQSKGFG
ncbi:hypothetical protein, partial [Salmonella sp. s51228]|uniref:hypothetical protein n=1 Tax=Salmonella sp. s51228 TaxID=3159652 RepID=UPI0039800E66